MSLFSWRVPERCRSGAGAPPGQTGPWVTRLGSSSPSWERQWGMSASPPAHQLHDKDKTQRLNQAIQHRGCGYKVLLWKVEVDGCLISQSPEAGNLGIILNTNLSFQLQIHFARKICLPLSTSKNISWLAGTLLHKTLTHAFISSGLDSSNGVLFGGNQQNSGQTSPPLSSIFTGSQRNLRSSTKSNESLCSLAPQYLFNLHLKTCGPSLHLPHHLANVWGQILQPDCPYPLELTPLWDPHRPTPWTHSTQPTQLICFSRLWPIVSKV